MTGNALDTLREIAGMGAGSVVQWNARQDALARVAAVIEAARRYEQPFPTDEDREALLATLRALDEGEAR